MGRHPREPRWLKRIVIDAVQDDQIREHGGLPGIRDEDALESALARPRNKWVYANERDFAALAAAYGFAIVTSHPYADGNKRVGFLSIVTFLGISRYDFNATDSEVLTEILALAGGRISEDALADWIRNHIERAGSPKRP